MMYTFVHPLKRIGFRPARFTAYSKWPPDPGDMTVFFEDLEEGGTGTTDPYTVTEEEIVEFGEAFDPQPFHIDADAPETTQHGGLIASGYHTLSIANRLLVDDHRREAASIAGLGVDDLRWHRPVRPGDTLTVDFENVEIRPSESQPEAGIIRQAITARNQDGAVVLTYETAGLIRRRSAAD